MSLIAPYLYDRNMARFERACLRRWRQELLKHVYGEALEVGAGTGANIDYYPDQVTKLVLTEPDRHMRRILERTVSNRGRHNIQVADGTAQQVRADDATFDCVVSSLVLCGIANVEAALEEVKRVLKPGGHLVFLERVAAAEGTSTRRWQDRINPIWRIMGCGHINRETEKAIIAAGFRMRDITRESIRKALPILRPTIRGVAEKPGKRMQPDGPTATPVVCS